MVAGNVEVYFVLNAPHAQMVFGMVTKRVQTAILTMHLTITVVVILVVAMMEKSIKVKRVGC
jgi:hypothetical protein